MNSSPNVKKIALAYSGGLDTSIIIPWLKEHYSAPIVAVIADVGQGDDYVKLREKAIKTGADEVVVAEVAEEFLTGYVWPTLKAGCIYDYKYLLGTSMARPLIPRCRSRPHSPPVAT